LYQTGYLTIKGSKNKGRRLILKYPNEEVEYGFVEQLMTGYAPKIEDNRGLFIENFLDDLDDGNIDVFMERLREPLALKREGNRQNRRRVRSRDKNHRRMGK
jgi:hypothetical protein